MTRFRYAALAGATALAAFSLAACKKDTIVAKDESVESVAKKVAASDVKPKPGRWEANMTFDKMDVPGMPPEAKAAMAKQLKVTQTYASCLTPEEAEKPSANFFQKGAQNCKYEHFVLGGGKIDAAMVCKEQNSEVKMTMTGSFNETDYDIHVKSQGEMQPGMPMTMEMTITAHHAGNCRGNEEA